MSGRWNTANPPIISSGGVVGTYMQAKPIGRCQAEALEAASNSGSLERADPGWTAKAHPLMPVILHQTVRSLADRWPVPHRPAFRPGNGAHYSEWP